MVEDWYNSLGDFEDMKDRDQSIRAEEVLGAYCRGIFPMAESRSGEIGWYRPELRGVIPLDGFRLPESDERILRRGKFSIRADCDFRGTMRACAAPRMSDGDPWISAEIIELYTQLHEHGFAHSVEAYLGDALVGGLYGIAIHGAFFGESMFNLPALGGSNSSKICLAKLVAHLQARGYVLLDTQYTTPHLERFGCIEISREEYEARLEAALELHEVTWGDFGSQA